MVTKNLTRERFDAVVARYARRLVWFAGEVSANMFPDAENKEARAEPVIHLFVGQMMEARTPEVQDALKKFKVVYLLAQPLDKHLPIISENLKEALAKKQVRIEFKPFEQQGDHLEAHFDDVPLLTSHESNLTENPNEQNLYKFLVATFAALQVAGLKKDQSTTSNAASELRQLVPVLQRTGLVVEPMEWLGSQKEQAELFIKLQEKGWIRSIKPQTIKSTFTKSASIEQMFKPGTDTKTGENTYEALRSDGYVEVFDSIPVRPLQANRGRKQKN